MKLLNNILNLLNKRQKILEILIVLSLFFSVSFKFGDGFSEWIWKDIPFMASLLILFSLLLALIWLRIEKSKMEKHIHEIKNLNSENNEIDKLTSRQREVYNLIALGKSNKEITNELFIELSTLKTHINKIYKTLEIKNRRELRFYSKSIKSHQ